MLIERKANYELTLEYFRYFIIQNAEFGLSKVENLTVFKSLFWLLLTVLVIFISTFLPLKQIFSEETSFPENIIFGQICLKQKFEKPETISIHRLKGFLFPIVMGIFVYLWMRRNENVIKRHCNQQRNFSCFGGCYRRNLMTFTESVCIFYYWLR